MIVFQKSISPFWNRNAAVTKDGYYFNFFYDPSYVAGWGEDHFLRKWYDYNYFIHACIIQVENS